LVSSLQGILDNPETKNLDLETSAKLWGLGLVRWKDDRYQFSCGLYQAYFQKIFSRSGVTGGLVS
ncbi:MAG: AAA-like domain-containing protein, partial [Prochlorotrichaceae cyanobacterium]